MDVRLAGDLPGVRPRFVKVGEAASTHAGLSPTGARAVFEARGEILTVPAEKGDVRNLTNTPGVPNATRPGRPTASRSPTSPTSRASTRCTSRAGRPRRGRRRSLGGKPRSSTCSPRWSPDSKKIAYPDKRNTLVRRPRREEAGAGGHDY